MSWYSNDRWCPHGCGKRVQLCHRSKVEPERYRCAECGATWNFLSELEAESFTETPSFS